MSNSMWTVEPNACAELRPAEAQHFVQTVDGPQKVLEKFDLSGAVSGSSEASFIVRRLPPTGRSDM